MRSVLWALLLLGGIVYTFAVLFAQAATGHESDFFANVPRAMLSLYQAFGVLPKFWASELSSCLIDLVLFVCLFDFMMGTNFRHTRQRDQTVHLIHYSKGLVGDFGASDAPGHRST